MSSALAWSPPSGTDVELLPAGRWWDAVKVSRWLAEPALDRLGDDSGAVIEDGFGRTWYWLVAPGGADGWRLQQVVPLGETCYLAVPPQHRTGGPGLRWRVPLAPGRYLTGPGLLHQALADAVAEALGPRRAGR
jgi:hypothetical protein